jgi:hypothetical protein
MISIKHQLHRVINFASVKCNSAQHDSSDKKSPEALKPKRELFGPHRNFHHLVRFLFHFLLHLTTLEHLAYAEKINANGE